MESLAHVDAEVPQHLDRPVVAYELRDRSLAEAPGDRHDGLDQELVGAVGGAVTDELPNEMLRATADVA